MDSPNAPRDSRRADVVVLAHGDEPLLGSCVAAVLASEGVDVALYVVDNGAPDAVRRLPTDPRMRVLSPGRNTGFALGCHLGADAGTADAVVFVNSDAVVAPDAVVTLVTALDDAGVGLVTGCVLLPGDRRDAAPRVNAAGNPVHYLGFSWCGGYGRPRSEYANRRDVASISGALFAVRRREWDALGGFDPVYFAYHEDVDLSIRTWCLGLRVVYVPDAACVHHYEFSRHPRKTYLLERNRLLTWLTVPAAGTLRRLALPLAAVQCMLLVYALTHRGTVDWLRAWAWIFGHPRTVMSRRRRVQAARRTSDEAWLALVEPALLPHDPAGVRVPAAVNTLLRLGYTHALGVRRGEAGRESS